MFCTKCGKELFEDDKFCAYCGAEVRVRPASKAAEVVFNPPFKIEAQKRTEEILKATEERKQEEQAQVQAKAKSESVDFDWNLEGFPTAKPRKTEDVDFNWDSVVEKRNRYESEPTYGFASDPEVPQGYANFQPSQIGEAMQESGFVAQRKSETLTDFEMPSWLGGQSSSEPASAYQSPIESEATSWVEKVSAPSTQSAEAEDEDDDLSIEELEKELFGDMEQKNEAQDDKFYTFNKKNDEFQELLDKEKQRVKSMEDEYNKQFAEMDYTWVPDVFPAMSRREAAAPEVATGAALGAVDQVAGQPSQAEQPELTQQQEATPQAAAPATELAPATDAEVAEDAQWQELEQALRTAEPQADADDTVLIGIVQPATPHTVDLTQDISGLAAELAASETQGAEASVPFPSGEPSTSGDGASAAEGGAADSQGKPAAEPSGEPAEAGGTAAAEPAEPDTAPTAEELAGDTPADKEKLRYSDIFPRADSEGSNNYGGGLVFDEEDEEPAKKHVLLKIIITLLIIAALLEGAILGIKFFAPDSELSDMIDNSIFKVADFLAGNSSDQGDDQTKVAQDEDVLAAYLSNIVTEKSADAAMIGTVTYNQELVYEDGKTYAFEEVSTADDFVDADWEGMDATYGEKLLEAVIKYYDSWIDTNKDESLVGINTLEIGEIKTGKSGFYTLCRVTYAAADGSEITSIQTVYTVISDGMMLINEIKEESV